IAASDVTILSIEAGIRSLSLFSESNISPCLSVRRNPILLSWFSACAGEIKAQAENIKTMIRVNTNLLFM
ncbi:MAG: hypothetical protein KAR45_22340, partial [Desulfobacteraceae bacterium]|nr:hypothetical protein [Desulfobacteraceae bacterium]